MHLASLMLMGSRAESYFGSFVSFVAVQAPTLTLQCMWRDALLAFGGDRCYIHRLVLSMRGGQIVS